jgi:hypothetical protein
MLQILWKTRGSVVAMAGSSSKMLQIARNMDRPGNPQKRIAKPGKETKTIPDPIKNKRTG